MKFYSTADNSHQLSFKDAVIEGLAPNKGLYFPMEIPKHDPSFLNQLSHMSLPEIGYEVMKNYVKENIPLSDFQSLIQEVLDFPIPLIPITKDIYSLELYHGPTLAFKDVGARFMSRCLAYFSDKKVTVLVATSGDTGSAVANGFFNVPGVDVIILYPANKISEIQEKQLTTLGGNITALAIDGVFDDCQNLVKQAFMDKEIKAKMNLSSANSINIARWLPQSIYYYWIVAQLGEKGKPLTVAVPSGNLGNVTAGILASKSGLNIDQFIAATNINDAIPRYLNTGVFNASPSHATISNAMDVGDPSNFLRLLELFDHDFDATKQLLSGFSLDDKRTREVIRQVYSKHNYILDPHGAVGYEALVKVAKGNNTKVFLETAHPIKFREVVEAETKIILDVPSQLDESLSKDKKMISMANSYDDFKSFLIQ